MFRNTDILSCIGDVVGWRGSADPCIPLLSSSLSASSSGLSFNDAHPLLSIANIEDLAPNFSGYVLDPWNIATAYSAGDKIIFNDVAYIALVGSTGDQPDTTPASWETLFSQWLQDKTNAYTLQFVNQLFQQKKLDKITKSLLEDRFIFTGMGKPTNKVLKQSRFVGFRVRVKQFEDLKATVNRLGFQFDTAQPGFNFYIYHDSQPLAPIITVPVVTGQALNFQNIDISGTPIEMFYNRDTYDAGGFFYMGYYEDDITGQAINKAFDFQKGSCGCAGRADDIHFRKYMKYMDVCPVSFSNAGLNGTELPDTDFMSLEWKNNFGVNFNVSVECDLTDLLCRHTRNMQYPLQKYVGWSVLKELAYPPQRTNAVKSETQNLARFELAEGTIVQEKDNAMQAMNFDFSNIDSVCLPCNEKNGIRIQTI